MSDKIKDFIDSFHNSDIYIPSRTIDITGSITEDIAKTTIKNLHALDCTTGTINIILNSDGGDFRQGMAIYDSIKGCQSYVRAICYGQCMSIATIILQGCDERLSAPNTLFMFHYGSNGENDDTVVNQERWYAQYIKDKKKMEDIYYEKIKQKKPRYKRKDLTELLKHDTILSVKETVELGLLDREELCFVVS